MKISLFYQTGLGGPSKFMGGLSNHLRKHKFKHNNTVKKIILNLFSKDCDVIHSTIGLPFNFWNRPYLLTIHGNFKKEKRTVGHFLFPLAVKSADVVTVPSHYLKNQLGLTNAIIIPNFVDTKEYTPRKHRSRKTINILTVTNFNFREKARGVIKVVQILSNLKLKSIQVNLNILGEGKFLEEIQKEVDKFKSVNGNLKYFFYGYKDPSIFYRISDIFVYFSFLDNMPLVIMEAMASGLPVVSNDIGAVNELIVDGDSGYVTSDDSLFLNYVYGLVKDYRLREKIGLKGRERMVNFFDINSVLKLFDKLYRDVKNGK